MSVKPKMKGLSLITQFRSYLDYVEAHLKNVAKAWCTLQSAMKGYKCIWCDFDFWVAHQMVEAHDVSKLCASEFVQYAEWFFGEYGKGHSGARPNSREHAEAAAAFEEAWEHHKEVNPHHWENWTKKPQARPGESACHVMCMVADWMAMSMTFGGTAEEYYKKNKKKINLPHWAVTYLGEIFGALRANRRKALREAGK